MRRPRREPKLPRRFRDDPPEPHSALPPAVLLPRVLDVEETCHRASSPPPADDNSPATLQSAPNAFGLFRQYRTDAFPTHDPEEYIKLADLSNYPIRSETPSPNDPSYHPYPNLSSFLLGDWYWNQGAQKSKSSFAELVKVVGHPDFVPEDIWTTNWDDINAKLGTEATEEERDWFDEDAGWRTKDVRFPIPVHRKAKQSGPQEYTVLNFHYRKLVDVIKEKLADTSQIRLFHYEPYELFWQRPRDPICSSQNNTPADITHATPGLRVSPPSKGSSDEAVRSSSDSPVSQSAESSASKEAPPCDEQDPPPIRVYGEMYTSSAFIEALEEVRQSPPEPGCKLSRHIVALMFWSDSTHLASFSDMKLHPIYLFFGNESKYRRCRPSLSLCNHVAYLEEV